MKKYLITSLIVIVILVLNLMSASARLDGKTIFDDVTRMTTEEIVAEMKYAIATGKDGKYYPQDRIHALEQQLAKNQTAEIERFRDQLKKDAVIAKKVEELKQKAITKAKEKGNEYYEKHKDAIQQQVEDETRKLLKMSETDWQVMKEEFNDMYEQGSKAYEEHLAKYVEAAQKAYDAYNAYNKAKTDHPEAPEAAQNLVGFLNATGEVLNFAGEKMDKTPLRPLGEILKMYGAATGLGNTAAKTAWKFIHREGINPNVQSQYSDGFKKVGLDIFDYSGIEKSNLMMFDKSIRILRLASGEYVVFNDKFEVIPGSSGNTLTAEEYEKLEQMYVAYANGKDEGWPNLTAEQLAKLARGDKVNVTVGDRTWPRSDIVKEFTIDSIMALGEKHAYSTITDDIYTSIDRILNGEQNVFEGLIDPFTRGGRRSEIAALFAEYQKNNPNLESLIHDREAFLEWVKEVKAANKNLTPEELKAKIRELLASGQKDKNQDDDDEDGDKNPLIESLGEIDPSITGANASGINTGESSSSTGSHWTQNTPEDFNGTKDGGFTNTGGTNRPMPGGGNPQSIGIPVLKPNIYLYPESTETIEVAFRNPYQLTQTIPEYGNYWKVTAETNGLLNQSLGFLFYEALVQDIYFQTDYGWKLPLRSRKEAFTEILDKYGFNYREKQDFIEFWTQKLNPETEYIVYPQETEIINRVMSIDVSPNPESIYRIWFYFIPNKNLDFSEPVTVDVIHRKGLTLVEWGGMYK